jgi:hypothetical protein
MKTDKELLDGLRDLCGYVEDGSSARVTILQDDATKDWFLLVDSRTIAYSTGFRSVISDAIDIYKGEAQ